ncbi:hypothetical protein SCLCIDRAFT_1216369 [Scleroderma citrinum Foug A]|uniref:BTB domain-containing protein n=1 Tax=Scleroderma citrinum Foug A TaxID=1036808 RepID=A0A0C3A880_9AGAM|nr:hypothetical protein SCLCIDRAFT_1216369 [Scleroderma citrinum Foug A]
MDHPVVQAASTPAFDDDFVLLCSSDGVQFQVPECFLRLTSDTFRGMFTLPNPHDRPSLRVVSLTEGSATLEVFLQLIYGVSPEVPAFQTLYDAKLLLEAIYKFEAEETVREQALELVKRQFLEQDPISLYIVACWFGSEDLAEVAAYESLKTNEWPDMQVWSNIAELQVTLQASDLYRLTKYRRDCGLAAANASDSFRKRYLSCGPHRPCPGGITHMDHSFVVEKYVEACRKELVGRPHPLTIQHDLLPKFLIHETAPPKLCSQMCIFLDKFRDSYIAHVKEAISKVKLEFIPGR